MIDPDAARKAVRHEIPGTHQGHVATRGFAQVFGLHPAVALLTITVDAMLGTLTVVSFGTLEIISLLACIPLGIITFMAQRRWYDDDIQNAFIKALIVSLLTAIPTPIPAMLYIPSGLIGLFHRKS